MNSLSPYKPLISIIIPNFNHAQYLKQRIDSILNQIFQNFEVIILDDCSTDSSKEVLNIYSKDPKVTKVLINDSNSGNTFAQWLKGIEFARGKYIWIAESDDFADEHFLEEIIPVMESNEKLTLAFCRSNTINDNGELTGSWAYNINFNGAISVAKGFIFDGNNFVKNNMLLQNNVPNASSVVFRKETFEKISKRFKMDYKINGDWWFWINLMKDSSIYFHDRALNYFRLHNESGSKKNVINFNNIREWYKLMYDTFSQFKFSPTERENINRKIFSTWVEQQRILRVKNFFSSLLLQAFLADRKIAFRILKRFLLRGRG